MQISNHYIARLKLLWCYMSDVSQCFKRKNHLQFHSSGKKPKLLTMNSGVPPRCVPCLLLNTADGWEEGAQWLPSCPRTPHAVMTSLALKVTECHFLSHFHAFVSVVVSVEYCFSFLDLVKSCSSFLTQLKCYSFEKPLPCLGLDPVGQHWVYFLSVPLLWMSRARHRPSSSLYIPVLGNSASHRDIFKWMNEICVLSC